MAFYYCKAPYPWWVCYVRDRLECVDVEGHQLC